MTMIVHLNDAHVLRERMSSLHSGPKDKKVSFVIWVQGPANQSGHIAPISVSATLIVILGIKIKK